MNAAFTNGNARGLDSQAEWTGYSRDLRIDETPIIPLFLVLFSELLRELGARETSGVKPTWE